MMSAPVARTDSGFIALTGPAVPTGMNAGVRISPRRIAMRPVRALPSVASRVNWKRVIGGCDYSGDYRAESVLRALRDAFSLRLQAPQGERKNGQSFVRS